MKKTFLVFLTLLSLNSFCQSYKMKHLFDGYWTLTHNLDSAQIFSSDTLELYNLSGRLSTMKLYPVFLFGKAKEVNISYGLKEEAYKDSNGIKVIYGNGVRGKWSLDKTTGILSVNIHSSCACGTDDIEQWPIAFTKSYRIIRFTRDELLLKIQQ